MSNNPKYILKKDKRTGKLIRVYQDGTQEPVSNNPQPMVNQPQQKPLIQQIPAPQKGSPPKKPSNPVYKSQPQYQAPVDKPNDYPLVPTSYQSNYPTQYDYNNYQHGYDIPPRDLLNYQTQLNHEQYTYYDRQNERNHDYRKAYLQYQDNQNDRKMNYNIDIYNIDDRKDERSHLLDMHKIDNISEITRAQIAMKDQAFQQQLIREEARRKG